MIMTLIMILRLKMTLQMINVTDIEKNNIFFKKNLLK